MQGVKTERRLPGGGMHLAPSPFGVQTRASVLSFILPSILHLFSESLPGTEIDPNPPFEL